MPAFLYGGKGSPGTTMMGPPGFSINPGTQGGSGAYGGVPGMIGLPPNLYSQTSGQFPGVNQAGGSSVDFINSEVNGRVSPQTQNELQRKAAAMGTASGSPGMGPGTFGGNNFLESLGLESENLAHQGVSDYLSFITGQGSQMTNPNLAFEVAQQNAIDASAPNPASAAYEMQQLAQPRGAGISYSSGGVSGPGISPINTYNANMADPSNPAVMYGPQGGGGSYTPTDPSVLSKNFWDTWGGTSTDWNSGGGFGMSPFAYAGLGLDTGLGAIGGGDSGEDYFSGGQAASDFSELFSDY